MLGHRFESAEAWTRVFDEPGRDAWQKPADVVSALRLSNGMTVADIGTGTGYFLPSLSKAVGEKGAVLAVDIEPNMVLFVQDRARISKWKNVSARLSRPGDPMLADGTIDRALIVNTWHHIADRKGFGPRVHRALRPDGLLVVVDFKKEARRGPPKDHRLGPEVVEVELKEAGFRVEKGPDLPDQYVIIGRK